MSFRVPEKYRVMGERGALAGMFRIPNGGAGELRVIAHDGTGVPPEEAHLGGWEHVSVSLRDRTPTWTEMCLIKDLFWDPEDCVLQFHPPKSQYVNCHPHCLHLWRRCDTNWETPPKGLL
jgi:hypothetical protein